MQYELRNGYGKGINVPRKFSARIIYLGEILCSASEKAVGASIWFRTFNTYLKQRGREAN
jgi:hypothetical protein